MTKPKIKKETVKTWVIVVLTGIIVVSVSYGLGMLNGIRMESEKHAEITAKAQALATTQEKPDLKQ